jgi:uncharacterized membrane protein
MSLMILGLVIFLGVHSIRVFADPWRTKQVARMGLNAWKGLYAVASLIGFVLLVLGYGMARQHPVLLWVPPVWLRHVAGLLTLPAFILFVCAYVPGTRIKRTIGHPMVAGVKTWASAHLLSNGSLHDVVLFGAFFVWSLVVYRSCRQRDRAEGRVYPAGPVTRDITAIIIGLAAWAAFAFWLHALLIGVRPMG